jgi:hypothetical protein
MENNLHGGDMNAQESTPQDVAAHARLLAMNEIRRRAARRELNEKGFREMGVSWPPLENWKTSFIRARVKGALKSAGFDAKEIAAALRPKPKGKSQQMKPGYEGKFELGTREVETPETYLGKLETVAYNTRHDPIERMFARDQIDEAQRLAGNRFRALVEMEGARGAKATDYTQEPVDGRGAAPDVSVKALEAATELSGLRNLLGRLDFALVRQIAGEGFNIVDVAKFWGEGKFTVKYVGRRFNDALSQLAMHWGYASDPKHTRWNAALSGAHGEALQDEVA